MRKQQETQKKTPTQQNGTIMKFSQHKNPKNNKETEKRRNVEKAGVVVE